jgi:hypothetical protein
VLIGRQRRGNTRLELRGSLFVFRHFLGNQTAERKWYLELKVEWAKKSEEDEDIGVERCCVRDILTLRVRERWRLGFLRREGEII